MKTSSATTHTFCPTQTTSGVMPKFGKLDLSKEQILVALREHQEPFMPFHSLFSAFCAQTGLFLFHVQVPLTTTEPLDDWEFTFVAYSSLYDLLGGFSH